MYLCRCISGHSNKYIINILSVAVKVAFAIGNDVNKEVRKEFTGTMESVFEVYNVAMFKMMFRKIMLWHAVS
jgi:hypothetical protein